MPQNASLADEVFLFKYNHKVITGASRMALW